MYSKRNIPSSIFKLTKLGITVSLFLLLVSGCRHNEPDLPPDDARPVQESTEETVDFNSIGYKIRTIVTPKASLIVDPITFEVYVDGNGNGNGLAGYRNEVYNVIISGNRIYIKLTDSNFVVLNDITGHAVPSSLDVSNFSNLSNIGFTLNNGEVSAYNDTIDGMLYEGVYEKIDSTFESIQISDSNSMTLSSFIDFILNQTAPIVEGGTDSPTSGSGNNFDNDRQTYYVESPIGISIHGQIYSITDTCNTDTYFENQIPVGIVPEYGWNKDVKVELLHISYTSSDGHTEVVTTDGYVQALTTTSPFKWLSLSSGMLYNNVQAKLGLGLKKDEQSSFQPMIKGLNAVKGKSNTLLCTYESINIELRFDSKTKELNGISLKNYIDFMEQEESK